MNAIYAPPNIIMFFVVYQLDIWSQDLNSDSKDCLFGGVEFSKNTGLDSDEYSCYSIVFNSCSEFSLRDGGRGKNVIIFGVDMS